MYEYTDGIISNGLNSTTIPYLTGGGTFGGTSNFLSYFYQFPGKFSDGINLMFGINEGGISILATVFVVAMILIVLFRFTSTNHN